VERFNTRQTLTSSEAAALLKVHPSTVKRWCNEGALDFETTEGGHRRIHLDNAVRFSRAQGIRTVLTPFHPYEPHVWTVLRAAEVENSFRALHTLALGWILLGETRRLEHLFAAVGRSKALDFCTFCDEGVRGLMQTVGQAWADGRLRVGEEHVVSQIMIDVLLRLRTEWLDRAEEEQADAMRGNGSLKGSTPTPGDVRTAVVGTLEGNHHHVGALCIRILLERSGWHVHYLGPDVPVDDFGTMQKGRDAQLVCISLGAHHTAGDVGRCVSLLGALYDRSRPYRLFFGGAPAGSPPDDYLDGPFEDVRVLDTCCALATHVTSPSPTP